MHPTRAIPCATPCANRIPRLPPSQRAHVNLNSHADGEPHDPVTEAELLRTIQARHAAQQWQRQPLPLVFLSVHTDAPPLAAEAATEIGAEPARPTRKPRLGPVFPLERWFLSHPTATTVAVLLAIFLLWGLASHGDLEAETLAAEAVEQLAQEVQP